MLWHFEFYQAGPDGKRLGGDKSADGSTSLEMATAQAKSMMENITFPFGRANLCLIKNQDGGLIREIVADA